jgi:aryl-alcohol dehydrogenase-like predicted oxidoreductase
MMNGSPVPRRLFRDDAYISILGLGGMVLVGMEQKCVDALVSESIELGVNYLDVAPIYGDGEAEQKLGRAMAPYKNKLFLACKTMERSAKQAGADLDQSLKRLHADAFDLYQFHAVSDETEIEEIFSPGGAMEAFAKARQQGKIRYIGFSAHSVEAALSMMDRFAFDSVLFPVNYINYERGDFGPQVMERAKKLGVSRLAIKAMAHGPWKKNEKRLYPNCWYRPIDNAELALQALRFTLSEDVAAAVPPGDERLFRLALSLAPEISPLTQEERSSLLASAKSLRPLMKF